MIQQNELITFLVGLGVAIFVVINRHRVAQIPGSGWLFLAFSSLLAGWTFTIIEGYFLPHLLNTMEHACYAVSSLAAAAWCWFTLVRGNRTP